MAKRPQREKHEPSRQWSTWPNLARYAVFRVILFLFSERTPAYVIAIITVLAGSHLLYVLLLPPADRIAASSPLRDVPEAASSLLGGDALHWLGWILFALALAVFVPILAIFWRRIQLQGDELKEERDAQPKDRVSSRNTKTIDEYNERMKQRFGHDDAKPDD